MSQFAASALPSHSTSAAWTLAPRSQRSNTVATACHDRVGWACPLVPFSHEYPQAYGQSGSHGVLHWGSRRDAAMHETAARPALSLWPPDDTEKSVLGTNLHQTAITAVRTGLA